MLLQLMHMVTDLLTQLFWGSASCVTTLAGPNRFIPLASPSPKPEHATLGKQ